MPISPLWSASQLQAPPFAPALFYDPIPLYTEFLSDGLQTLPAIVYDPEQNALSGTLALSPGMSGTLSYAVRVTVTGTVESGPAILNQAAVYPANAPEQRVVSELVIHFTQMWAQYVPFMLKEETAD